MTHNYTFKNQSSTDNIPTELKGILKDTIILYTSAIQKEALVCIFAKGSMPRGNFKPGVSDFDTDAIVHRELTKRERAALKEERRLLEDKYKKRGVVKIDIGAVSLQRFLVGDPKLTFVLSTDGVCIFGEAPTLKRAWPNPGNELSKLLNREFPKKIELYRNHLSGVDVARANLNVEQWIAKEAVRLLFGITMHRSREYTAKIEAYRYYVEKYLTEGLANFDRLYAVYMGGKIRTDELLVSCEYVLRLARAHRAI